MSSSSDENSADEKWEDPYRQKKSYLSKWIGGICFAVLLYLLSTGPIAVLYERSIISTDTMAVIHAPLKPIADVSPQFRRALNWYIGLWVKERSAP